MTWAMIDDNGTVMNIISASTAVFDGMIPLNGKPVSIGDAYKDGTFYRDGEEVMSQAEEYARALEILGLTEEE